MKKRLYSLALISMVFVQSCSKESVKETIEKETETEAETETETETEATNNPPSSFSLTTTEISSDAIELDWTDATDPEGKDILYTVFVDNAMVKEALIESEYTVTELSADTSYEIKIVASDDKELTSEISETITTEAEQITPSILTVSFGEGNVVTDTPISEAEFGILSLPIKLTDENGQAVLASEDLDVNFKIESNDAFQFDYKINSLNPLRIKEGESEAIIEIEVIVDDMIEIEDESFTVIIESVEMAVVDETKKEATYIIAKTEVEDLPEPSANGPRVDISWSNSEADVNAVLFKVLGSTGQTSASIDFFSTNEPTESFVLEGYGNAEYFLMLERNDDVFNPIEVTILITQPDGTRLFKSILMSTSNSTKDVVDFEITDDGYTFEFIP